MRASLSILGLYQRDPTLFDELELPGDMNKDVLIDSILYEAASLEAYYPDPNFMKFMIGRWSFMNQSIWQKLYDTTVLEYNPIYNYDRTEEWTENEKMLDGRTAASTETETRNLKTGETSRTDSNGDVTTTGTMKTELNVSGYNEVTFTPSEETIETPDTMTSNNVIVDGTRDSTNTGTVSIDKKDTESLDRKRDNLRTGRAFGNIGVTTTQQMIQQERETVTFNMYKVITDSFVDRFCLMVYT
jgi:hypothetical protein